jgi:hypothetical protein
MDPDQYAGPADPDPVPDPQHCIRLHPIYLGTLLLVAIGVYHPGYHAKNEKIQFKDKIMKHMKKTATTLYGNSEPKSVT